MTFLTNVRRGVAEITAAESGGVLKFSPAGEYLPTDAGLYSVLLPEHPDTAVAITLYPVSDLSTDGDAILGCQFMMRSSSISTLDAIEDAIASSWTRRPNDKLAGETLVMSKFASGASLGQDSNDRLRRSANFYLTIHRPNTNRT